MHARDVFNLFMKLEVSQIGGGGGRGGGGGVLTPRTPPESASELHIKRVVKTRSTSGDVVQTAQRCPLCFSL